MHDTERLQLKFTQPLAAEASWLEEELERRVQERTQVLEETNRRLQAEISHLKISETRFRTIFEQSPLSMQILSPDGYTLQVNRAWENLFGLTLSDLTGYSLLEDQQLVDRGILPQIQKALQGEAVAFPLVYYDAKQTFREGRDSWTQSFMYPVRDDDGNLREVVLMHQDVTALKQAEQLAKGQTEAIARTLNLLAAEPALDAFLGQVLKALTEQLSARAAGFWLHDPSQQSSRLHVDYDDGEIKLAGQSHHPGTSGIFHADPRICQVCQTRQPRFFNDIAHEPLLAPYRDYLLAKGIESVLIVPLFFGEDFIGAFSIRRTEKRSYRLEELELAQALAQQATLAIQLTRLAEQGRQAAVLEERNRMARDIHDTLAQTFTGILIQLGVAKRIMHQEPEEAWRLIEQVSELAREGLAAARRSVWSLYAEAVEYTNLPEALSRSLQQMSAGLAVHTEVTVQGVPEPLSPEIGLHLLRIGQEALTNALRHAQSQRLWLEIEYQPQRVRLQVRDDGQGFDPNHGIHADGFGLIGMRQRAERIGGQLTIASQPGQGTAVVVEVPLGPQDARQSLTRGNADGPG